MSETALIRRIAVWTSRLNARLFRNNCGQYKDAKGNWVRYGVANPGGSDLIGWTPLVITPEMAGRTIAIFTAIEVKAGRTVTTAGQKRFLRAVSKAGGIAMIAREEQHAAAVVAAPLDALERGLPGQEEAEF